MGIEVKDSGSVLYQRALQLGAQGAFNDCVMYLAEAAKQGVAEAQYLYARHAYDGMVIPKNYTLAVKWFRKASEQGCKEATYYLSMCYENGYGGLKKNKTEAFEYKKKAAEQGHTESQLFVVKHYLSEYGGLNRSNATSYLQMLVAKGVLEAEYYMGTFYYEGVGVAKDNEKGLQMLRNAAEKGYDESWYYLSRIYYEGIGMPKNKEEAAKCYRVLADKGDSRAQCLLGKMYEKGDGIPQDKGEAAKWYAKAIAGGNRYAQERMDSWSMRKYR